MQINKTFADQIASRQFISAKQPKEQCFAKITRSSIYSSEHSNSNVTQVTNQRRNSQPGQIALKLSQNGVQSGQQKYDLDINCEKRLRNIQNKSMSPLRLAKQYQQPQLKQLKPTSLYSSSDMDHQIINQPKQTLNSFLNVPPRSSNSASPSKAIRVQANKSSLSQQLSCKQRKKEHLIDKHSKAYLKLNQRKSALVEPTAASKSSEPNGISKTIQSQRSQLSAQIVAQSAPKVPTQSNCPTKIPSILKSQLAETNGHCTNNLDELGTNKSMKTILKQFEDVQDGILHEQKMRITSIASVEDTDRQHYQLNRHQVVCNQQVTILFDSASPAQLQPDYQFKTPRNGSNQNWTIKANKNKTKEQRHADSDDNRRATSLRQIDQIVKTNNPPKRQEFSISPIKHQLSVKQGQLGQQVKSSDHQNKIQTAKRQDLLGQILSAGTFRNRQINAKAINKKYINSNNTAGTRQVKQTIGTLFPNQRLIHMTETSNLMSKLDRKGTNKLQTLNPSSVALVKQNNPKPSISSNVFNQSRQSRQLLQSNSPIQPQVLGFKQIQRESQRTQIHQHRSSLAQMQKINQINWEEQRNGRSKSCQAARQIVQNKQKHTKASRSRVKETEIQKQISSLATSQILRQQPEQQISIKPSITNLNQRSQLNLSVPFKNFYHTYQSTPKGFNQQKSYNPGPKIDQKKRNQSMLGNQLFKYINQRDKVNKPEIEEPTSECKTSVIRINNHEFKTNKSDNSSRSFNLKGRDSSSTLKLRNHQNQQKKNKPRHAGNSNECKINADSSNCQIRSQSEIKPENKYQSYNGANQASISNLLRPVLRTRPLDASTKQLTQNQNKQVSNKVTQLKKEFDQNIVLKQNNPQKLKPNQQKLAKHQYNTCGNYVSKLCSLNKTELESNKETNQRVKYQQNLENRSRHIGQIDQSIDKQSQGTKIQTNNSFICSASNDQIANQALPNHQMSKQLNSQVPKKSNNTITYLQNYKSEPKNCLSQVSSLKSYKQIYQKKSQKNQPIKNKLATSSDLNKSMCSNDGYQISGTRAGRLMTQVNSSSNNQTVDANSELSVHQVIEQSCNETDHKQQQESPSQEAVDQINQSISSHQISVTIGPSDNIKSQQVSAQTSYEDMAAPCKVTKCCNIQNDDQNHLIQSNQPNVPICKANRVAQTPISQQLGDEAIQYDQYKNQDLLIRSQNLADQTKDQQNLLSEPCQESFQNSNDNINFDAESHLQINLRSNNYQKQLNCNKDLGVVQSVYSASANQIEDMVAQTEHNGESCGEKTATQVGIQTVETTESKSKRVAQNEMRYRVPKTSSKVNPTTMDQSKWFQNRVQTKHRQAHSHSTKTNFSNKHLTNSRRAFSKKTQQTIIDKPRQLLNLNKQRPSMNHRIQKKDSKIQDQTDSNGQTNQKHNASFSLKQKQLIEALMIGFKTRTCFKQPIVCEYRRQSKALSKHIQFIGQLLNAQSTAQQIDKNSINKLRDIKQRATLQSSRCRQLFQIEFSFLMNSSNWLQPRNSSKFGYSLKQVEHRSKQVIQKIKFDQNYFTMQNVFKSVSNHQIESSDFESPKHNLKTIGQESWRQEQQQNQAEFGKDIMGSSRINCQDNSNNNNSANQESKEQAKASEQLIKLQSMLETSQSLPPNGFCPKIRRSKSQRKSKSAQQFSSNQIQKVPRESNCLQP